MYSVWAACPVALCCRASQGKFLLTAGSAIIAPRRRSVVIGQPPPRQAQATIPDCSGTLDTGIRRGRRNPRERTLNNSVFEILRPTALQEPEGNEASPPALPRPS